MFTPERVLFSCRQHAYVAVLKSLRWLPLGLGAAGAVWISESSAALGAVAGAAVWAALAAFETFLWNRSRFVITPQGLRAKVRNGLFSTFETHIRFDHIRDSAYSKNNLMHFLTGAGTLFARSSAGAEGDFQAQHLPHVEKIFSLISFLAALPAGEREKVESLPSALENARKPGRAREKAVADNLAVLKAIPGVTGAFEVTDDERRFVFETEEDRNHGVYDTLRRQVVLCFTHDAAFRDADAPIVLKLGGKAIFPPVSFHEVRERNVVSSSPSLPVHERLVSRVPNAGKFDATVFVGFDL